MSAQTAAAVPAGCFVKACSLLCLQPIVVSLWVCLAGAAGVPCTCIVFLPLPAGRLPRQFAE